MVWNNRKLWIEVKKEQEKGEGEEVYFNWVDWFVSTEDELSFSW